MVTNKSIKKIKDQEILRLNLSSEIKRNFIKAYLENEQISLSKGKIYDNLLKIRLPLWRSNNADKIYNNYLTILSEIRDFNDNYETSFKDLNDLIFEMYDINKDEINMVNSLLNEWLA